MSSCAVLVSRGSASSDDTRCVGCQLEYEPGERLPTLSTPVRLPSNPWKTTCTRSALFAPASRAKKRTHGSSRLTGRGELSAVAPGPSCSACAPGPETCHGSLPETTEALPVSVHDCWPCSKPRFGKEQYASSSPQSENGCEVAPQAGRSPLGLPADATGTASPAATRTAVTTSQRRLLP